MSDLTDFLIARIAEDEEVACHQDGGLMVDAHFSEARVLAECEAKRRIVEEWGRVERFGTNGFGPGVLRHLASVYADHPDYREEWRA